MGVSGAVDPWSILKPLLGLLVCIVLAGILRNYPRYLPPDFTSDFLLGREAYFHGGYRWAFYAHLAAGPITLLLGLALISDSLRRRLPAWHRGLGRLQIAIVLLLLAPSGLWMSTAAATGAVAGIGFATSALMTVLCALLGWRAAVQRRFAAHGMWMTRLLALLCSAVALRLLAGLADLAGLDADGLYPTLAWASWLLPLAACEAWLVISRRVRSCGRRCAAASDAGPAHPRPYRSA